MALQFTRTDAGTGHVYTVYARIDGGTILVDNATTITLNLYDSLSAARSGFDPVFKDPDHIHLTNDEMTVPNLAFVQALTAAVQAGTIHSPSDALKTSLYVLLKQRAAYSGSVDV